MSILNELKRIAKDTPNNQDLGARLRGFLDSHRTCCDDPENLRFYEDPNGHPHGKTVEGLRCVKCGKLSNTKIS